MNKYLVDVNLPYYFRLWNSQNYIHQQDILPTADDESIWEFAREKNLTIITKDCDFSNRILLSEPPPKVIHIRIGNMKINKMFDFLTNIWVDVLELSDKYKLVNVFPDRLEAID